MADRMEITVDTTALLAALAALGSKAEAHVKAAARVTADRIAGEARGRVRRATGKTGDAITVDEGSLPLGGWRVYVAPVAGRPANLPQWLEFGTKFMSPSPFMFSSARLEEGAHLRRVSDAIQAAIEEHGLGG